MLCRCPADAAACAASTTRCAAHVGLRVIAAARADVGRAVGRGAAAAPPVTGCAATLGVVAPVLPLGVALPLAVGVVAAIALPHGLTEPGDLV